jgi:hypothetical protein
MNRRVLLGALSVLLLPLTGGCYTKLTVNFGNSTPTTVWVKSAETGEETEVPAGRFRKMPHGVGDLIVTTSSKGKLRFTDVSPMHVAPEYLSRKSSIFGPGFVTLTVALQTNLQLHVVMPGKKTLDQKIKQPTGYPKAGTEVREDKVH